MLVSPYDLKYFLEVAQTQNVTRAAERLGITQPSLSLALQRVESGVGAALLVRSKSGARLTKAGVKVANHARDLLADWERLREVATESETVVAGSYSIGCHVSVALYSLPLFLPKLLREHPQLETRFTHGLSRQVTEEVISWKLDFGIVVNPVQHPDLVIRELCRDEVTLWKAASGASNVDTLIHDPELIQTQSILKDLAKRGHEFRRTMTSPSLEVVASLTSAGGGVGVLPERVARLAPGKGLKRFSSDAPVFRDRICLIYRADSRKTAASEAISRAIQAAGI